MRSSILVWAVILLLIPAFGVFAGGQAEEEAAEIVTDGEGPSWSWDTSPIEIGHYMHEGWYSKRWNPDTNIRDEVIEESTGVSLDISVPTGDAAERLNTMIAGDNLPDFVTLGWWFEQVRQMEVGNMLYPLNELIDDYAPDFWDIIPQSMVDWYRADDGNWYQFPNFFWAEERLEQFPEVGFETNAAMYARADIMDDLGIVPEDFETQDGMIEALKKVQGYEYDDYPVTPVYFSPEVITQWYVHTGLFAVPREDSDGNLLDERTTDRYLEMLQFMNRIYREGLMNDENFIESRTDISDRKTRGEIFLYIGNNADYVGSKRDLFRADNDAKYVAVGPVRNSDGERPQLNSSGLAGWQVNVIPRTADRPDRVIRLFHYLYSEEGQLLTNYGVEGVTYETVDGQIEWTDYFLEQQADDPDRAQAVYGDGGGVWWFQDPVFHRGTRPAPATEHERLHMETMDFYAQYTLNDLPFTNIEPPGGTVEQADASEIATYWDAQLPDMIMADSPEEVERIWRASLEHIRGLGLEGVTEVRNELFQENKERLGIEYAWPPNRE